MSPTCLTLRRATLPVGRRFCTELRSLGLVVLFVMAGLVAVFDRLGWLE